MTGLRRFRLFNILFFCYNLLEGGDLMSAEFSHTSVSMKGQQRGAQYVDEYCNIHNLPRPSFYKMFNDQDMLQYYIIGMTVGAIDEYHQQLRAYFREQGISIPDFIENPLIPSRD